MRISDGVQTCALPISVALHRDLLFTDHQSAGRCHLAGRHGAYPRPYRARGSPRAGPRSTLEHDDGLAGDRKSVVSGKSVSVRVDLGGRRISKKKRQPITENASTRDQEHSTIKP